MQPSQIKDWNQKFWTELHNQQQHCKTEMHMLRQNIPLTTNIKFMQKLVCLVFLYTCESGTLIADLLRCTEALEMKCYHKILNISYRDHITNEEVRKRISAAFRSHDSQLNIVKKKKMMCYGQVIRSSCLRKNFLQGTDLEGGWRGRHKKRWEDDILEWTGLSFAEL